MNRVKSKQYLKPDEEQTNKVTERGDLIEQAGPLQD